MVTRSNIQFEIKDFFSSILFVRICSNRFGVDSTNDEKRMGMKTTFFVVARVGERMVRD